MAEANYTVRTVGIAAGDIHSLILKQDGSVWSSGLNSNGQLGNPSISYSSDRYQETTISSGATALDAGLAHSIVLTQDGGVWMAGADLSVAVKTDEFVFMREINGAKAVAAGGGHSLVLAQHGSMWGMGMNFAGQLGDGTHTNREKFIPVFSSGAKAMAAGHGHSIVLKVDGSVWATGWNKFGQQGDGSTTDDRTIFVQVMPGSAEAVSAGAYHSMVLKQDGTVWTTGWNQYGQLGDGTLTDCSIYRQVSKNAKAISAGARHSIILKKDGSVWSTLFNVYGQLGDFLWDQRGVFIPVISSGGKALAAGSFHSMVLKEDGNVWAAGSNKFGQIGYAGVYSDSLRNFVPVAQTCEEGATHDAVVDLNLHVSKPSCCHIFKRSYAHIPILISQFDKHQHNLGFFLPFFVVVFLSAR